MAIERLLPEPFDFLRMRKALQLCEVDIRWEQHVRSHCVRSGLKLVVLTLHLLTAAQP